MRIGYIPNNGNAAPVINENVQEVALRDDAGTLEQRRHREEYYPDGRLFYCSHKARAAAQEWRAVLAADPNVDSFAVEIEEIRVFRGSNFPNSAVREDPWRVHLPSFRVVAYYTLHTEEV